jgi:hypothetical protein
MRNINQRVRKIQRRERQRGPERETGNSWERERQTEGSGLWPIVGDKNGLSTHRRLLFSLLLPLLEEGNTHDFGFFYLLLSCRLPLLLLLSSPLDFLIFQSVLFSLHVFVFPHHGAAEVLAFFSHVTVA